jgi:predicted secreted acid phosphatase
VISLSRRLIAVAVLAAVMVITVLVSPTQAAVPGKKKWLADTRKAMYGSRAWVNTRVARGDKDLAVNLDIDNTSLATYYSRGHAVPVVLRFVKYADSKGVTVLFNTGRLQTQLTGIVAALRRAGYPVDGVCGRKSGERLATSKQRCRAHYTAKGHTIIANVGNRSTDFVGSNYERAFRLPNYGGRLG